MADSFIKLVGDRSRQGKQQTLPPPPPSGPGLPPVVHFEPYKHSRTTPRFRVEPLPETTYSYGSALPRPRARASPSAQAEGVSHEVNSGLLDEACVDTMTDCNKNTESKAQYDSAIVGNTAPIKTRTRRKVPDAEARSLKRVRDESAATSKTWNSAEKRAPNEPELRRSQRRKIRPKRFDEEPSRSGLEEAWTAIDRSTPLRRYADESNPRRQM